MEAESTTVAATASESGETAAAAKAEVPKTPITALNPPFAKTEESGDYKDDGIDRSKPSLPAAATVEMVLKTAAELANSKECAGESAESVDNATVSNASATGHPSAKETEESDDEQPTTSAAAKALSTFQVEAGKSAQSAKKVSGTSAGVAGLSATSAIDTTVSSTTATASSLKTDAGYSPKAEVGQSSTVNEEDAKWHTVGIFSGHSTIVSDFIDNSEWSSAGLTLASDNLPDLSKFKRINLETGSTYRFRLRAINHLGTSDWSEISSFKTCMPGFPGAPSAIKISKSSEGAHLTWEPPPTAYNTNEISEYSVYLAVKPGRERDARAAAAAATAAAAAAAAGQRPPTQLAFVRVYVGLANQCVVSHATIASAHIDTSNKPAIIFRIAARNDKGYGPATQVRWLQETGQSSAASATGVLSAMGSAASQIKLEQSSAISPTKRFKPSSSDAAGSGDYGSD